MGRARVAILAQDLIWSTRLASLVEAAGASPKRAKTAPEFTSALGCADGALIDLFASNYDGVAAVEQATARGLPVVCVAQHDDLPLRKRALAAGAHRVYSYNKVFTDGRSLIEGWLASLDEPVAPA